MTAMTSEKRSDRWIVFKVVLTMVVVFGPLAAAYLWASGAFDPCTGECVYNTGAP